MFRFAWIQNRTFSLWIKLNETRGKGTENEKKTQKITSRRDRQRVKERNRRKLLKLHLHAAQSDKYIRF